MSFKEFFQENIWASALVLIVIIIAVCVFMYFRIKEGLDKVAEISPEADVFGNIFGKTWGRIIPFLLFIGFIIISWFLTKLYQK